MSNAVHSFYTFADQRIPELRTAVEQGLTSLQVTYEVSFTGGSRSGTAWSVPVDSQTIAKYESLKSWVDVAEEVFKEVGRIESLEDALRLQPRLIALRDSLPADDRQGADGLVRQIDGLVDRHARLKRVASVKVPLGLTAILTWLCIWGLLVPLGFLSAHDDTSKVGLLAAFALGIIALPIYLGFQLVGISVEARSRR
jgi:hypothetical protein